MLVLRTAAVVAVGVMLAACADNPSVTAGGGEGMSSPASGAPGGPSAATVAVIAQGTALPAGYKIDMDRTMIFGTDERWVGRLTYSTGTSADEVFDFLHREMPNFGWTETSAMRSDVSMFTFSSAGTGRMASIHISRGSALGGGTRVDMVVSPQTGAKR